jgi:hypothetical protein
MDKEILKKGLTKYINRIIKPKVDYEIVINTRNTLMNREDLIFYILFIIDHSKFWRGNRNNPNPNFSQEYNDEVNNIYMDGYTEELETAVKLFGVSEPDVRIEYKSINKEIYDPLIKSLNNDYYGDFKPEFMYGSPALGLEFVYFVDISLIQTQLDDEGFDTEDIAFYN